MSARNARHLPLCSPFRTATTPVHASDLNNGASKARTRFANAFEHLEMTEAAQLRRDPYAHKLERCKLHHSRLRTFGRLAFFQTEFGNAMQVTALSAAGELTAERCWTSPIQPAWRIPDRGAASAT